MKLVSVIAFLMMCAGGVLYGAWEGGLIGIIETASEGEAANLRTLPYASWAPIGKSGRKQGVTRFIQRRSFSGLNLYNTRDQAKAILIDMQGKVVHSWEGKNPAVREWHYVLPARDARHIFVISKDQLLAKIDWDSAEVWSRPGGYHHDVSEAPDGRLFAVSRAGRVIQWRGESFPILDDYVEVLTAEGGAVKSLSVFDLVRPYVPESLLQQARQEAARLGLINSPPSPAAARPEIKEESPFDILHTNAASFLTHAARAHCRPGDLLVSVREINLVACIDWEKEKIVWSWGPGELEKQHHPTLLSNGNILIFDNRSHHPPSRVVEVNPHSGAIEWQAGPPELRFFSFSRGAAQRLPNGNTLVTISDNGRAVEITRSGEIVWEFYNPDLQFNNKGKATHRAAMYRMVRNW